MGNPHARSRKTEIASLLESFLDSNRDNLSGDMFSELDSLAGDIDENVEGLEKTIEELESEKEELERKVNEAVENQ